MSIESCDVLVVGGGPVGLALAGDLGRRGVGCVVIDAKTGFHEHPRATCLGPRSMEIFRSWGIVDRVLDAAVPEDFRMDVSFVDDLAGEEVLRLRYPTIAEMRRRDAAILREFPQLHWSRYAKVVVGQHRLEPVLHAFAVAQPSVSHRPGHEFVGHAETADGIVAVVRDMSGAERRIAARYLVGCDGGRSAVRRAMGVRMGGTGSVGASVNVFFRCPGLLRAAGRESAMLFWIMRKGANGAILAIDGRDEWVFSRHLMPDETEGTHDPAAMVGRAIGCDIPFEIVSWWPWTPRELVAGSYRVGRALLAGDAAHLMSPTGGYGLNTGLGDAVNLAWKLAAVVRGWAPPELLDTYGPERRPIVERSAAEATDNRRYIRGVLLAGQRLDEEPAGRAEALDAIARSRAGHGKHFDAMGLYLGDRYDASSIVIDDGTPAPRWDAEVYEPSCKPGGRLPLVWDEQGGTLHDRCGDWFSVITSEPAGAAALVRAFEARGTIVRIVHVSPAVAARLGGRHLIVRPDGFIAWRSAIPPSDGTAIIRRLLAEDTAPPSAERPFRSSALSAGSS
ncbi:FAD-dependent monooxygenase [Roseomonas sp. NAR14]|uniref:FAD-dependent monooxygenase n=1 Tax=Roseomonas acroporae TaxID=2937791 RepID=A0A9X1YGY2_9PROT|nr:FAD-dependent monooxygenase [Roseomonas acroporae]MCK8786091.1 FAD-dependent monooxygenase [Roseomonas acroporae]